MRLAQDEGPSISRRAFLQAGACVGGGLLIGIELEAAPRQAGAPRAPFAPNAFIRIDRAGRVLFLCDKTELGQGVTTALPMLIAEELEVGLDRMAVESAPPNDALYADPILRFQGTSQSTPIRGGWERFRSAGAAARMMLITAAAARWNVKPEECRAQNGSVLHSPSNRALPYGALVDAAAALPIPQGIELKSASNFKLIGTSPRRLDSRAMVTGQAQYGIDVQLQNMKFASVRAGKLENEHAGVITLPGAVAAIADNTWTAMQRLNELRLERAEADLSVQRIRRRIRALGREGFSEKLTLETTYESPFLAHAPMEPLTCVAHIHDGLCEVWTATQAPTRAQAAAANASGLPLDKIVLHNLMAGGSYGRRLETDFIDKAVRIAREVDAPVKVTWSREEDIRQDFFGAYWHDNIGASLDANGKITSWKRRIVGPWKNAGNTVYDIPNYRVEFIASEPKGVRTGYWEGGGAAHDIFVVESFLDDCAAEAKQDPLAYRRALLHNSPRALQTLALAAQRAGWGTPVPARTARGIAVAHVFDTYVCAIAQVHVTPEGMVQLQRVVCAVDCGIAVHPSNVIAQIESGVLFGLSTAMFNEITFEEGRVQQGNFNDYRMMRMSEAPRIEVQRIPSGARPGGIGEVGAVIAAPALANALFSATGIRVRMLPVIGNSLVEA